MGEVMFCTLALNPEIGVGANQEMREVEVYQIYKA